MTRVEEEVEGKRERRHDVYVRTAEAHRRAAAMHAQVADAFERVGNTEGARRERMLVHEERLKELEAASLAWDILWGRF